MLAYVFWHVPRADAAAREYELRHREFHAVLRAANVAGLRGVRVFRLNAIPWLGGKAGYEDWHLLDDSAGLDVLNHAAITQARQLPHDRIAALAGDGIAGLYGLRQGKPIEPAIAYWMSKPEGMSYAAFEASLAPHRRRGLLPVGTSHDARADAGVLPARSRQAPVAASVSRHRNPGSGQGNGLMKAYVIVNVNVKDPARYADYVKAASPTVTAHGGRYMAGEAGRRGLKEAFP